MQFIKNQPVVFNQEEPCQDCDPNYVQLVKQGDVTQFQVKIGDCWFPEQRIPNGSFSANLNGWNNVNGWIWDDGKACNTSNAAQYLESTTALILGRFYRVEIEIASIVSTDATDPNSGVISVSCGVNTIGHISAPGNYVFYGVQLNINTFTLTKAANTEVCVEDVAVYEISIDHIVAIYDIDDNFVLSLKVSDFIDETTFKTDVFSLMQNFLTVKIDWSDKGVLSGDCYYFCLLDPCVNTNSQNFLYNGNFEINDASPFVGWALNPAAGATLAIPGTQLIYSDLVNPIGTLSSAQQNNIIGNGCEYEVEIQITNISGTDVFVRLGTNSTIAFNGVGTFTDTITSNGTFINIRLEKTDPLGATCNIEYVKLTMSPPCYECDHISNIFKLEDNFPFCTLRLNVAADHNIFGLQFVPPILLMPDFTPTLRMKAKLVNPMYDFARDLETNTDNTKFVKFYQRDKRKALKTSLQPEYIHDFLSLLPGYDHFYVEDTEYVVEDDEYALDYSELDNMASLVIEVMEKEQPEVRNVRCTDANFPQIVGDIFIGEPRTGFLIGDPSDNTIALGQPG